MEGPENNIKPKPRYPLRSDGSHEEVTGSDQTPDKNVENRDLGELSYASLDDGIAFFEPDGKRHQFSSPQEETELQMAAAAHMATGQQTPGMPKLDMAMLGPDGQPQIKQKSEPKPPEPPPAPPPAPPPSPPEPPVPPGPPPEPPPVPEPPQEPALDPKKFIQVRDIGSGDWTGFGTPSQFYYRHPDAKNPDGTFKRFTEEEVESLKEKQKQEGTIATDVLEDKRKKEELSRATDVVDFTKMPELVPGARIIRQQEIQANPEWERNFLLVVERLNKDKGALVYANAVSGGVMETKDLVFLEYARAEFANRLAAGEKLQKRLEGQAGLSEMEIAKRRNQAFRVEANLASDDKKTLEIIRNQAMVLAMKMSAKELNDIGNAFATLDAARDTRKFKKYEADVQKVLAESKIPFEKYKTEFKTDDREAYKKSVAGVRERILEGRGWLGRLVDHMNYIPDNIFFGPQSRSEYRADKLVRKSAKLDAKLNKPGTIQEANNALSKISGFLYLTLTHDVEVQRAFQQSAMGNEVIAPLETRPATFKEMRSQNAQLTGNTALSPQNLRQLFERDKVYARSRDGSRGWAEMNQRERADWRDNTWNAPEMTSARSREVDSHGGGIMAAIFALLFGAFLKKSKSQLNTA